MEGLSVSIAGDLTNSAAVDLTTPTEDLSDTITGDLTNSSMGEQSVSIEKDFLVVSVSGVMTDSDLHASSAEALMISDSRGGDSTGFVSGDWTGLVSGDLTDSEKEDLPVSVTEDFADSEMGVLTAASPILDGESPPLSPSGSRVGLSKVVSFFFFCLRFSRASRNS